MALLEIEGLVSGYTKELNIVNGISLKVEEGKMVSIIGPNGAGKSTVLRTIFGLLQVRQGRILFRREDVTHQEPFQLLEKGLSFVPQGRNIFPFMTVKENLEFGAYVRRHEKGIKPDLDRIYDMFPILRERSKQRAARLSGGELQMLEMGRALLLSPALMLIDEPSLGLSPRMASELFNKIEEIKEKGTTILIVEQNADRSLRMSDYAYVLEMGQVCREGPAEEIRNDDEIKRLYLGG